MPAEAVNTNVAPYEVIAGPVWLWVAPALTGRPDISVFPLLNPGNPWALIGTDGPLNYTEEGLTVSQPQEVTRWRALGDTGSRKAFRTSEDFGLRVVVADLTLATWRLAMNSNTVTPTPAGAAAGSQKIGLSRGPVVRQMALLLRFPSPVGADLWSQLWIPRAVHEGSPEPVFQKGEPAGLALDFMALVNTQASTPDEYFGVLEYQDAPPTT